MYIFIYTRLTSYGQIVKFIEFIVLKIIFGLFMIPRFQIDIYFYFPKILKFGLSDQSTNSNYCFEKCVLSLYYNLLATDTPNLRK